MTTKHDTVQFEESSHTNPRTSQGENEFLVLRNHDFERAYDVKVFLTDANGRTRGPNTFVVPPGQVRCILAELPDGRYRVRVSISGDEDRADVVLGSDPTEFALIETGNGAVSVTEG